MSQLTRGDLVWTLDSYYALVDRVQEPDVHLIIGTGERIIRSSHHVMRVDAHGTLVGDNEACANFASVML